MSEHFIKSVDLVTPKMSEDGAQVVVLERVKPGVTPDYCIHGKVGCYECGEWCWLGDKSYELVRSGDAVGLCVQCATKLRVHEVGTPIRNVRDHRRADGPHE